MIHPVTDLLEPRRMLAATLSNGQLLVEGTEGRDTIVLSQTKGAILVRINGKTSQFPTTKVKSIQVNGLAGRDHLDARAMTRGVRLDGGLAQDTLRGGAGNDTLDGGRESASADPISARGYARDVFFGGGGVDTADYSHRTENLSLSVGDVTGGIQPGCPGCQVPKEQRGDDGVPPISSPIREGFLEGGEHDFIADDVENIIGGKGADAMVGNHLANRLEGGPGDDQFYGEREQRPSSGDVFAGGSGRDHVSYDGHAKSVRLSRDGKANDGSAKERDNILSDVEIITGSRQGDILIGSGGDDWLVGNEGNDTVQGQAGNDTVVGGPGRDIVRGGDGDDLLVGFDSLHAVIFPDDQIDTLFGEAGNDTAEVDPQDVIRDAEVIKVESAIEEWPEPEPNPDA